MAVAWQLTWIRPPWSEAVAGASAAGAAVAGAAAVTVGVIAAAGMAGVLASSSTKSWGWCLDPAVAEAQPGSLQPSSPSPDPWTDLPGLDHQQGPKCPLFPGR